MGVKADLSRNLRVLLAEKMMSITELHRKTGVSRTTIHSIYSGRSGAVRFDVLDKLCEALKIEPSDLLKTKKTDRRQAKSVKKINIYEVIIP